MRRCGIESLTKWEYEEKEFPLIRVEPKGATDYPSEVAEWNVIARGAKAGMTYKVTSPSRSS
jgi:hypothetical protein